MKMSKTGSTAMMIMVISGALIVIACADGPELEQGPVLYTVAFNANGATGGAAPLAQKVDAGSSITLPDEEGLTRTGYTFGGLEYR